MELLAYLARHFLTREQLLAASGISAARLDALTEGGHMPQPSYRLRLGIECTSFFGEHADQCERLRQAVDLLDRASSAFAPHERLRGSRHRLVDAMRLRFGLQAP